MWWKLNFSERERSSEWKTPWERQEPCTRTPATSSQDFLSGKGLGQSTGEVCQHRAGSQRNMEDKDWKVEWREVWTFKHNHRSQKRQDILPRKASFYHRGP